MAKTKVSESAQKNTITSQKATETKSKKARTKAHDDGIKAAVGGAGDIVVAVASAYRLEHKH